MSSACKRSCSNVRCLCKRNPRGKPSSPIGHLRSNVMTVLRRWFPQNDIGDPPACASSSHFNNCIEALLYKFSRLGVYEGLAQDYHLRAREKELELDVKAILTSMKLKVSELRKMGSCSSTGIRHAEDIFRTKNRMLSASLTLRRSLISMIDQDYEPSEATRFKICSIFSLLDEIEGSLNTMETKEGVPKTMQNDEDRCMPAGDCLPVCPEALNKRVVSADKIGNTNDNNECDAGEIALSICGGLRLPTMGPSMARLMKRRMPIIEDTPCELAGLDVTYTKMKRTIYETKYCSKTEITEEDVIESQVCFTLQPDISGQSIGASNIRLVYRTAEADLPENLKNESNKKKLSMLSNVWLSTARHLVDIYFDNNDSQCPPCTSSY